MRRKIFLKKGLDKPFRKTRSDLPVGQKPVDRYPSEQVCFSPDSGHRRTSLPCPFCAAGSTGRRNTCAKSLCWGFKLQGLSWPFVELTSHFVQIGLRVHRQVGALGRLIVRRWSRPSLCPTIHAKMV